MRKEQIITTNNNQMEEKGMCCIPITVKALGCVHAKEINQKLAEEEPCDV